MHLVHLLYRKFLSFARSEQEYSLTLFFLIEKRARLQRYALRVNGKCSEKFLSVYKKCAIFYNCYLSENRRFPKCTIFCLVRLRYLGAAARWDGNNGILAILQCVGLQCVIKSGCWNRVTDGQRADGLFQKRRDVSGDSPRCVGSFIAMILKNDASNGQKACVEGFRTMR